MIDILYCPIFRKHPHVLSYAFNQVINHRIGECEAWSDDLLYGDDQNYLDGGFAFFALLAKRLEDPEPKPRQDLIITLPDVNTIADIWEEFQQQSNDWKSLKAYKLDHKMGLGRMNMPLDTAKFLKDKKEWIVRELQNQSISQQEEMDDQGQEYQGDDEDI